MDDISDVDSDISCDSVNSDISTISDEFIRIDNGQKFFEGSNGVQNNHNKILTSAISSNGIELIFSLTERKCNNFCLYELCCTLFKSHRIMIIEHLNDAARSFTLPKKSNSKHYNRLNMEYTDLPPMPDNILPPQSVIEREKVMQKIQSLNNKEKSFSLRSDSGIVTRTSADLVCPCCGKFYSTTSPLENHLTLKHGIDPEKARIICKSTNATQTLVNALKQQVHRQQRFHQWNILKKLQGENLEEGNNNDTTIQHQSTNRISLPSIEQALSSFDNVEPSPEEISNLNNKRKTRIPTRCATCGNMKGRKECGSCKSCCLKKGGCKYHFQYYKLNHSTLHEYSIIADCETTDFKDRSLIDFYAENLSDKSIIKFDNFIRPRRRIERSVVALTNISNEMVVNGEREKDAISRLAQELPKKSIIVAHNSAFDRDAIFKAYMYWKQKKLLKHTFNDHHLIFVDSLGIIKQKLLNLENYTLGTVFKKLFCHDIEDQHRAMSDVLALRQILEILQYFGENLPHPPSDVIGYIKDYMKSTTIKSKDCIVFDAKGNKLDSKDLVQNGVLTLV